MNIDRLRKFLEIESSLSDDEYLELCLTPHSKGVLLGRRNTAQVALRIMDEK